MNQLDEKLGQPANNMKTRKTAGILRKIIGFITACAIGGALVISIPALAGNLKEEVIPPQGIAALFKRLGYDAKTIAAAQETVAHMEQAQAKLGSGVVLGAMVSESRADKPRILKDITNNPAESFSALFGTNELTLANHETVFDRLLPDKYQISGYKKRVIGLGSDMTNAWFQTFNAVVRKMPAQNVYLLQQALITTSSIYSYNNPTINIASISASVVADQLHRLMLLVSNDDFTVVRFIFGDTLNTSYSRRLPNRESLKTILGDADITLPERLYDIAEAGAHDVGTEVDNYVAGVMKDQEIARTEEKAARTEEKAARTEEKAARTEERTMLMASTNSLFTSIDNSLQMLIKNPNDAKLVDSIRRDMAALQAVKKQWEALPQAQKKTKAYQESMKLIASIEQMVTMQRISW